MTTPARLQGRIPVAGRRTEDRLAKRSLALHPYPTFTKEARA
ncbi:hypothetical protein [Microbacterium sp. NPDC057650]